MYSSRIFLEAQDLYIRRYSVGCSLVLPLYAVLRASIFVKDLSVYICLICVLVWSMIRVCCTVSGPSIIMSTFYLRRHWLIPVLQNFRQRFFGLSVSDHGIVWFDSWSKCMMYCVPSLRSIIAGWDVLFFNLLLKSLIFSRKSWVFGHHI